MIPDVRELIEKMSPDQSEIFVVSPSSITKMERNGVIVENPICAIKTPNEIIYRFRFQRGIYGKENRILLEPPETKRYFQTFIEIILK